MSRFICRQPPKSEKNMQPRTSAAYFNCTSRNGLGLFSFFHLNSLGRTVSGTTRDYVALFLIQLPRFHFNGKSLSRAYVFTHSAVYALLAFKNRKLFLPCFPGRLFLSLLLFLVIVSGFRLFAVLFFTGSSERETLLEDICLYMPRT